MEKVKTVEPGQQFLLTETQGRIPSGSYVVLENYPLRMLKCRKVYKKDNPTQQEPDRLLTENFYQVLKFQQTIVEGTRT